MAEEGRQTGVCTWFNVRKGYGFITPDNGEEAIFVHQSALECEGFRSLADGSKVEFDVVTGDNGKTQAVKVSGIGGVPCEKQKPKFYPQGNFRGGYQTRPYGPPARGRGAFNGGYGQYYPPARGRGGFRGGYDGAYYQRPAPGTTAYPTYGNYRGGYNGAPSRGRYRGGPRKENRGDNHNGEEAPLLEKNQEHHTVTAESSLNANNTTPIAASTATATAAAKTTTAAAE